MEKIKEKVREVLQTCREQGFTLNLDKFHIARSVEIGGICISSTGDEPPKIKATNIAINKVTSFKTPTSKKDSGPAG